MSLTDQLRLTFLLICLISLSNAYEFDDDGDTLDGFEFEEFDMNYVELMQFSISPDEKSQR